MARGEWGKTTELIAEALAILELQHPMTLRQVFYQLVAKNLIENRKSEYASLSTALTKARRDGRVPWEYINDRTRPTYEPRMYRDLAQYSRAVAVSYRRNHWASQPNHVEVWSEKDAIYGSIEELCDNLGVVQVYLLCRRAAP
jgi:hypothetical protein